MRTPGKARIKKFIDAYHKFLTDIGAVLSPDSWYHFKINTTIGTLNIRPDRPSIVFCQFDDFDRAADLLGCNRYSGKWNFCYISPEDAICGLEHDFGYKLKAILTPNS